RNKTVVTQGRTNKIICVANQKGGVAKTTTAAYLGAALARLNKYVLVIDSDPQCNLTYSLELDESQQDFSMENNLATIYESGQHTDECILRIRENLFLIAGSSYLVMTEITMDSNPQSLASEPERMMRNALVPLRHRFDYTIIDCPPSQGMLTLNAL